MHSVAFIFSSFSKVQEAFFISNIDELTSPSAVTSENSQYDQIDLPEAQAYQWTNEDDNRTIEGILYYPPGKFQEKNLPLLVLIHGSPLDASLNYFLGNWYIWASLAATEGWLILEPNYRGSTGYGDAFADEIRLQSLTRPGRDILFGVDRLTQDGNADRTIFDVGYDRFSCYYRFFIGRI
jgi:dipeptidyl aminopeptidase/acylaminoacyl peptidase